MCDNNYMCMLNRKNNDVDGLNFVETQELMRDRLLEKIKDSLNRHIGKSCLLAENIADDLLENGVIVPPVEIGQELWDIHYNKPRKWEVCYIGYNGEECFINIKYFKNRHDFATRQIAGRYLNRLYFFTKEEAEQALKGGAE